MRGPMPSHRVAFLVMTAIISFIYLTTPIECTTSTIAEAEQATLTRGFKYPVAASWLKGHESRAEWSASLARFQRQGGHIVWQRGRPLRIADPYDIYRDPNYAWCFVDNVSCLQAIQHRLAAFNSSVANFLVYDYDEGYSRAVIMCPEVEFIISSSRIYYILVLPVDSQQAVCAYRNTTVNVLLTSFDHVDSKELLMAEAAERNMSVYLGMPGMPQQDGAQWNVDVALLPSFYEFTRRVLIDYVVRFQNYSSFKGVYQSQELSLGADSPDDLYPVYQELAQLVKENLAGRVLVLSPYVDVNLSQINNTVADHKANFKRLARTGPAVIAVQEGRGVAKAAYYWPHQVNMTIESVDPMLLKIVQYLDPSVPSNVTYAEQFTGSTRMLFEAFATAQLELKLEEGISVELWANLEAFEYLRDAPCLPVDQVGDAMAEILDRTAKQRIDWGLTNQGALVNQIISFAWDSDYLCYEGTGYTAALTDEIIADGARPIVAGANIASATPLTFSIDGFYLDGNVSFVMQWAAANGTMLRGKFEPSSVDTGYGSANNKSPLLQRAMVAVPSIASSGLRPNFYVEILGYESSRHIFSYHEFSFYYCSPLALLMREQHGKQPALDKLTAHLCRA